MEYVMFDNDTAGLSIEALADPTRIGNVFAYFVGSRAERMPKWLQTHINAAPNEDDLRRAAEAWATHDPGHLDMMMLWPHECDDADDAMLHAAEIAKLARYRVLNKLTGEPWAASQARLGAELTD